MELAELNFFSILDNIFKNNVIYYTWLIRFWQEPGQADFFYGNRVKLPNPASFNPGVTSGSLKINFMNL